MGGGEGARAAAVAAIIAAAAAAVSFTRSKSVGCVRVRESPASRETSRRRRQRRPPLRNASETLYAVHTSSTVHAQRVGVTVTTGERGVRTRHTHGESYMVRVAIIIIIIIVIVSAFCAGALVTRIDGGPRAHDGHRVGNTDPRRPWTASSPDAWSHCLALRR